MLDTRVQTTTNVPDDFADEVVAAIMGASAARQQRTEVAIVDRERRALDRRPVGATGTISQSPQHAPLPCAVIDLCDIGARLDVEDVDLVPTAFELTVERLGLGTNCIVVWRTASEVGVVFQTPQ